MVTLGELVQCVKGEIAKDRKQETRMNPMVTNQGYILHGQVFDSILSLIAVFH